MNLILTIIGNANALQMPLIFNTVKVTKHESALSIKCSFVILGEHDGNTDCSYGRGQNLN